MGGVGGLEVKTASQLRSSCAKRHFLVLSCDCGAVVATRRQS